MIKTKFKGFSIAELLIVLAIIGIIATMGITISKKSTENAYNLYIYTGYKAIYEAIVNSEQYEYTDSSNNLVDDNDNNTLFIENIIDLLDAEIDGEYNTTTITFKTPNGISYKFEKKSSDGETYFEIEMTVPAAKTDTNTDGKIKTMLAYFPDKFSGVLVPYSEDDHINVQDDAALLPFKIETGKAKGFIKNGEDVVCQHDEDINTRGLSYKDAFCRCHSSSSSKASISINETNFINCSTTPNSDIIGGGLVLLDKHPNIK